MKMIQQLAGFILGVTAGVCLFSLVLLRPLSPERGANSRWQVVENRPNHTLTPSRVQQSVPRQVTVPVQKHSSRHFRPMSSEAAEVRLRARPQPHKAKAHEFVPPKTTTPEKVVAQKVGLTPPGPSILPTGRKPLAARWVQARYASTTPQAASGRNLAQAPPVLQGSPALTLFKAIGYVEKADGQLEAIILQEDQIQVVHMGDRIADGYRVTSITQDVVGATDETMSQVAMSNDGGIIKSDVSDSIGADATDQASRLGPSRFAARPEVSVASVPSPVKVASSTETEESSGSLPGVGLVANSLGYVEKYDGKVEAVLADGESVRLVPATESETMAQPIPPGDHGESIHAVQTPTAQGFTAAVTIASSALGDSAIHPGGPIGGAILRQVVHQDSTPAADGNTPAK